VVTGKPLTRGAVVRIRDEQGVVPNPFLVISSDDYHRRGYSVILAAMTAIPGDPGQITAVRIGSHGLVFPDRVRTTSIRSLAETLGRAEPAEMEAVDMILRAVLDLDP